MTEIEKIQAYISKYGAQRNPRYDISMKEALAVVNEMVGLEAIVLAFNYSRAKGYRAAKAEARHGR